MTEYFFNNFELAQAPMPTVYDWNPASGGHKSAGKVRLGI